MLLSLQKRQWGVTEELAVAFFSRWKAKAPREAEKGCKEWQNEKRWKRENTEPTITGNSTINAFIYEHAEFLDSVEVYF